VGLTSHAYAVDAGALKAFGTDSAVEIKLAGVSRSTAKVERVSHGHIVVFVAWEKAPGHPG